MIRQLAILLAGTLLLLATAWSYLAYLNHGPRQDRALIDRWEQELKH